MAKIEPQWRVPDLSTHYDLSNMPMWHNLLNREGPVPVHCKHYEACRSLNLFVVHSGNDETSNFQYERLNSGYYDHLYLCRLFYDRRFLPFPWHHPGLPEFYEFGRDFIPAINPANHSKLSRHHASSLFLKYDLCFVFYCLPNTWVVLLAQHAACDYSVRL